MFVDFSLILLEALVSFHQIPVSFTLQPEIVAKLIPKTLLHVTEMRFSKKIIPKTFFNVIL